MFVSYENVVQRVDTSVDQIFRDRTERSLGRFEQMAYGYRIMVTEELAMDKAQKIQDPFLNALRKERIPVSIFLKNGIKLQG